MFLSHVNVFVCVILILKVNVYHQVCPRHASFLLAYLSSSLGRLVGRMEPVNFNTLLNFILTRKIKIIRIFLVYGLAKSRAGINNYIPRIQLYGLWKIIIISITCFKQGWQNARDLWKNKNLAGFFRVVDFNGFFGFWMGYLKFGACLIQKSRPSFIGLGFFSPSLVLNHKNKK